MGKRVFSDEGGLSLERFWAVTNPHRKDPERSFPKYRKDAPNPRALVLIHCGLIAELCHIGEALEWLIDESGENMNDYLEGDGSDLPDGAYIWEGKVKDAGSHDSYYDVYESDPYLDGEFRLATKEEWECHVRGDYPWDPELWLDYGTPDPPSEIKEEDLSYFPNLKS